MKLLAKYKNGKVEEVNVDRLEVIRVDIYTFIYDRDIELCTVFYGEDDLMYLDDFSIFDFNESVCLDWINRHVIVKGGVD